MTAFHPSERKSVEYIDRHGSRDLSVERAEPAEKSHCYHLVRGSGPRGRGGRTWTGRRVNKFFSFYPELHLICKLSVGSQIGILKI